MDKSNNFIFPWIHLLSSCVLSILFVKKQTIPIRNDPKKFLSNSSHQYQKAQGYLSHLPALQLFKIGNPTDEILRTIIHKYSNCLYAQNPAAVLLSPTFNFLQIFFHPLNRIIAKRANLNHNGNKNICCSNTGTLSTVLFS